MKISIKVDGLSWANDRQKVEDIAGEISDFVDVNFCKYDESPIVTIEDEDGGHV